MQGPHRFRKGAFQPPVHESDRGLAGVRQRDELCRLVDRCRAHQEREAQLPRRRLAHEGVAAARELDFISRDVFCTGKYALQSRQWWYRLAEVYQKRGIEANLQIRLSHSNANREPLQVQSHGNSERGADNLNF